MSLQETLVTYTGTMTKDTKTAADTFAENFMAEFEKKADPLGVVPNNETETITGKNGIDPGEVLEERKEETPNVALTNGRSENEAFTSAVEKANVARNLDILEELFTNSGEAGRVDRATVKDLFEHGKPGQFVTRSRTLTEQVRGLK